MGHFHRPLNFRKNIPGREKCGSCLRLACSHWSNLTMIPYKSWRPSDKSRSWEMTKEFKIRQKIEFS